MNRRSSTPPTAHDALEAFVIHHAALRRQLDDHVRALGESARTPDGVAGPLARLRVFLTDSVLAHAAAEERTLYRAAAASSRLALLVDALIVEHHALRRWTHALGDGRGPAECAALAERLGGVFALHVEKENDLLLPVLDRNPHVDLLAVLHGMHEDMAPHDDHSVAVRPMD